MKNKNMFILIMVFLPLAELHCSLAPYIPSYDDRYEYDLQQANANKDYFKEPADNLNYADYHYVGAKSAEKYPRFFAHYIMQEQPIPGILSTGVRGLNISVYNWSLSWSSIISDTVSTVCSSPTTETTVFRKNGKPLYQTLHYEMNRIFNFLKSHPQAIITIFLDDYADIGKIMRDIGGIIEKNKYNPFFKLADWPQAEQGKWPTLGWMRKHNRRLIVFTRTHNQHTDFTWPLRRYFWENNAGSTDENVMCAQERLEGVVETQQHKSLVSFGCYETAALAGGPEIGLCADYDAAKRFCMGCQKRNFAQGKLFNVYWIDHVIRTANQLSQQGKKTLFDYVNELNDAAQKKK